MGRIQIKWLLLSSITVLSTAINSESCIPLVGTLSCPDWATFYIKPSLIQANSSKSPEVGEFDIQIHKLLDPNNIPYSPKLIEGPSCATVRAAVSQLSQPLLCAATITDPTNSACPSYPSPICHHACTRQVDTILSLIESKPSCFVNSNQANFYDTRASLMTTCSKPNLQGPKGSCLLLDAQDEKSSSLLLDSRVVIGIGVGGGIMILFLILIVTGIALRRRAKSKKLNKSFQKNNESSSHETLVTDFPFFARRDDEIQLSRSDEVCVFYEFDDGWAYGKNFRTGHTGKFPLVCLNKGCAMQPLVTRNKGESKHRIIPKRTSSSSISVSGSGQFRFATPNEKHSKLNSSFSGTPKFMYNSSGNNSQLGIDITPSSSYRKNIELTPATSHNDSLPDITMTQSYKDFPMKQSKKPYKLLNYSEPPAYKKSNNSSPETIPSSSIMDATTVCSSEPQSLSRNLSPNDEFTPQLLSFDQFKPLPLLSALHLEAPRPLYASDLSGSLHSSITSLSFPLTPPPPSHSPPRPPVDSSQLSP